MSHLIETFQERQSEWWQAIAVHVQVSLLALLLAIAIAVPLAIAVAPHKRWAEWSIHVAGIFQTVPSLALLGLLIPLFGIGTVPAVIALVVYGLFPILQNTITGLRELDPSLAQAATAFGMTRWEKLRKYELAIAMPVIVSGIRTAAVLIIGTATLAALIGAGGLGSFILLGIDRNHSELILIGALSAAFLAVVFNVAIRWLEKRKLKTVLLTLSALTVGLVASFMPFHMMMQSKKLVIAGKLGTEPEILIHLYKAVIEAETDIAVEVKPNFGKTTFLFEALKKGDIDVYPEFTGTVLSSLLQPAPTAVSHDPELVYEMARAGLMAQDNLVLLPPMRYQNTYAVAVPRSYAEQHGLQTISDLKKVVHEAVAGFTLEFADREDGNRGLQERYQLQLMVRTLEPALRYQAIQAGDVQITDAYSTDSELREFDLVVLTDDQQLFLPYQGAPLLRQETLVQYPEVAEVLGRLANRITEEEMQQMNYEVRVNGRSAESVARAYLIQNGLLQP